MKKGYKQTEIGIIPEDWEMKKLGDDVILISGQHILADNVNNKEIGLPYITGPSDFEKGVFNSTKYTDFPRVTCKKNDILITVKGSGTGKMILANKDYCISRQLMAIRTVDLFSPFIFYILRKYNNHFSNIATGLIPGISRENILDLPIPLPPLPEQTAIAEALSDTDELLTTLEKLIEKKKLIKKGTMQELLTGKTRLPGFNTYSKDAMHRVSTGVSTTIPRGYRQTEVGLIPVDWEVKSVGDVITFQGGSQPPLTTFRPVYKEGYIRLLQIRDYKTNKYETYIPKNLARRFCNKEDIMIGRYGPPIFQILKGLEGAYNVALLKAIPTDKIVKEYAYYFLKQDIIFNFVEKLSQRSSGQTGVDLPQLKSYPLGLPSVSEQTAIAETLSDMDSEIEMLEKKLEKTKQIKQGMMQELLTGRIRIV